MRSEQIHRAIAQGHSRFDICQIVAKGLRVMHKPGTRFEDSITVVLDQLSEQKGRSVSDPAPHAIAKDIPLYPAA